MLGHIYAKLKHHIAKEQKKRYLIEGGHLFEEMQSTNKTQNQEYLHKQCEKYC